ncbi:SMEK domain-containing protein [Rhizobium sp. P38BS-XIX]|uniref:SMEK domain-containing protein n=1 Tax=Rhizobium sp. P38BS-XIX TaxID=2726740 RepID=UPI0014564098|nr:SMEK domain-containing protein [Rhizobium sp. P38BS-XIX]NLR96065.1 SMEK domain-containing protein [Rhizobium sp. P38BS-XIX]
MNTQEYLNQIKRYFTHLVVDIKCNNASDHFDINKIAENFFIPILSIIFDCPDLNNQNLIKANFPSVDLGSIARKLSFQITSDGSSSKIIHTLEKFREHKLEALFDELYILVITEKQGSYTSKALMEEVEKHSIAFNVNAHVIDYTDLMANIAGAPIEKLRALHEALTAEFERYSDYNRFRNDLEGFLHFSNSKIEIEKNTKKYIPSIYVEPIKSKETTRIFGHPTFFGRKIEDEIRKVDYSYLNKQLAKIAIAPLTSAIIPLSDNDFPRSIEEVGEYLTERKALIDSEIERVNPFGHSPKNPASTPAIAPEKEAMQSLLKLKTEGMASYAEWTYIEALGLIKKAQSKILLITSVAGQGKTNFICDLVENQFAKFEIPTVFIPARELNKYPHPNRIFSFISQNRFLPKCDDVYDVLDLFNQVSKGINKAFIVAIDGINEVKELDSFLSELSDFLNAASQFEFIKTIITCRTEFFDSKFSSLLSEPFSDFILRIEDLKAEMSDESLRRMLRSYLKHFQIKIELSRSAASFLKSDLLMMRIFCDLNEGKDKGYISDIYKIQLYQDYLLRKGESLPKQLKKELLPSLYRIAQHMLSDNCFHNINIGGYTVEQQEIVERLVSEDIILRREPSEKTLDTMLDETISFTYDELRDFIIATYLVKDLAKTDSSAFCSIFASLEPLPIYEGVFKYVYLIARQSKDDFILKQCEDAKSFDEHYSHAIATLPHELQTEDDVERVIQYLDVNGDKHVLARVAVFLFNNDSSDRLLNRRLLVEHINLVDDPDAENLLFAMFRTQASARTWGEDPIKDFLRAWLENPTPDDGEDLYLIFIIQLAFLADYGLRFEVESELEQIKGRGKNAACFAFVENARSSDISTFAKSIDAFVGKSK